MRQNKKNKRFIYLISPNKIKNGKFYSDLNQVLSSKKVSFFQLRLKKESFKNQIYIGKKIKKICKKHKVKFLINDNPVVAKKVNADGCHLGQKDMKILNAKKILKNKVSEKINPIPRKVVSSKEGTASLADVKGYDVGGKTGTAQKAIGGKYSKIKINTFASIFPTSKPKFVLIVLLEDTKLSKDYVYKYRNKPGSFVGTPFNTAGWTSVEVAAKIIEKIGPILATTNFSLPTCKIHENEKSCFHPCKYKPQYEDNVYYYLILII